MDLSRQTNASIPEQINLVGISEEDEGATIAEKQSCCFL